jgi:rRNA maturation endonuclease Nob1
MHLSKRTVCTSCAAEFEIEALEDYPILFCAACGVELEEDEAEVDSDE